VLIGLLNYLLIKRFEKKGKSNSAN
jgi:hypothetical protein